MNSFRSYEPPLFDVSPKIGLKKFDPSQGQNDCRGKFFQLIILLFHKVFRCRVAFQHVEELLWPQAWSLLERDQCLKIEYSKFYIRPHSVIALLIGFIYLKGDFSILLI
jgi:hypothetical protein